MRVNIYYGGRGLIDDPSLYVLGIIEKVLDELHVKVERYNLYEDKSNISVLPKTLKGADGVILAVSVEWLGIGWLMQQFLDACWLYGDKDLLSKMQMMSVVISSTYGERQAQTVLVHSWEMLGGIPDMGICAYVDNHLEFETDKIYNQMIEKRTEEFYRGITRNAKAFPSSCQKVKKNVLRSRSISLTPQESEQLSAYAANDTYVKKQKEDIEELASLFKGMLNENSSNEKFVEALQQHFYTPNEVDAVFQVEFVDIDKSMVMEIHNNKFQCYYGTKADADVTMKTKEAVFKKIVGGSQTFQNAFMSGDINAQGKFQALRNLDSAFRF